MGLSFRKSIKIGKNTRINLSKTGGVGISTGVKGARVSVNKKGVRTTVGAGGIQYRKDYSFKNNSNSKNNNYYRVESPTIQNTKLNIKLSENVNSAKKVHTLLTVITYGCLFIGFVNPIFLVISLGIILYMFINKNAKQRMYVSTAAYNLKALKIDKANKYLQKAKIILDNELTNKLEEDINNSQSKDSCEIESPIIGTDNERLETEDSCIFDKQVERNLKGKEFEKQGDLDSAIALYELNIKDGFEGTHPYDRLAIIYRRQKKYDDEIRVINRAIEVFSTLYLNCDIKIRKDGYKETVEKLEKRLEKAIELKNKNTNLN